MREASSTDYGFADGENQLENLTINHLVHQHRYSHSEVEKRTGKLCKYCHWYLSSTLYVKVVIAGVSCNECVLIIYCRK